MQPDALPKPDADDLQRSQALSALLRTELAQAGGWMRFDRWMAEVLYRPALGYYAARREPFGRSGDFVTAPMVSPLFARCLARQCGAWFATVAPVIHEFGAGDGGLAAGLLRCLEEQSIAPREYRIVELSATLRERQRERLEREVPHLMGRVRWLDAWPQTIEGVVVANELLDAMPVRLFRCVGETIEERGVALDSQGHFMVSGRPADAGFAAAVGRVLAEPRQIWGGQWPHEFEGELPEIALAWVGEVARRLERGALLLIDYGFPRAEFYHPQRDGTVMCHYRHRAHGDPFFLPGLQDITAHVDFTGVADAAHQAGLDLLGYTSQARFLMGCGIVEMAHADTLQGDDPAGRLARSQALRILLSESEMGELFKVIALGKGVTESGPGFASGDRSHRL